MTVTVQEAEVVFSAAGLTRVQAASRAAGKALDGIVSAAGLASRGLMKIGNVGKRALASVAGAAGKAYAGIRGMVSGLTSIPQLLAASAAAGAVGGLLKMAADVETLHTQFAVLTGSAETATKVMDDVNKFAATTPFEPKPIADAARSLLAFGGSADTVIDELRMLGDIAAATAQPLGELAELYGKAKVQGRLFGEDINQLTGRGIPVIQALAAQFGVAESEVKGLVAEGKIGFPELQRALAGMTGPGGKFHGMMEQLSTTTAGKFSTFIGNVKLLGAEIGGVLLPRVNDWLDRSIKLVGAADGIGNSFQGAIVDAELWHHDTRTWLEDIGIVSGSVAAEFESSWERAFDRAALNAFDFFNEFKNASTSAIDNLRQFIGVGLDQAQNEAIDLLRPMGPLGFFAKGGHVRDVQIGDPMRHAERAVESPLEMFNDLAVDVFSALSRGVADAADMIGIEELRRQAARAAIEQRRTNLDLGGFTPQDTPTTPTTPPSGSTSEALDPRTTRGSAASVFASVQESLANKAFELQKKQVELQKAAMAQAAKLNADTIKALNFGLG